MLKLYELRYFFQDTLVKMTQILKNLSFEPQPTVVIGKSKMVLSLKTFSDCFETHPKFGL